MFSTSSLLADVAGLGQGGRVSHHKRYVKHSRQGLREQGLARPRWTDEQNVALGKFNLVLALAMMTQAFVVVVDGHRQDPLGLLLTNYVLVEESRNFLRGRQIALGALAPLLTGDLVADDVVAELDTLITDEH